MSKASCQPDLSEEVYFCALRHLVAEAGGIFIELIVSRGHSRVEVLLCST